MTSSNQEFTAPQLKHADGLLSDAEDRLEPLLERLEAAKSRALKRAHWDTQVKLLASLFGSIAVTISLLMAVTIGLLSVCLPLLKEVYSQAPFFIEYPRLWKLCAAVFTAGLFMCGSKWIMGATTKVIESLIPAVFPDKPVRSKELDDATEAADAVIRAIEGEGKADEGFLSCFAALLDGQPKPAAQEYLIELHLNGYEGRPEWYGKTLRALRRGAKARLEQLAGEAVKSNSAEWLELYQARLAPQDPF